LGKDEVATLLYERGYETSFYGRQDNTPPKSGVNPWDWTVQIRKVWQVGVAYNEKRKDLAMRKQRSFSLEFKRQVIEELLSGESCPAQLCRRYNISSSVLYH
jgi:hypothetical protein